MAFPGTSWATRTPAEVGLNATKLTDFRNATGNNVGFVVKNGYQVFKWGAPSSRIDWASAGKPLTSTMLFFAVKEGKLGGVDALIKNFGWALRTADQNMTFRHLADMLSGYALPENPGTHWGYNDYGISLYNKTLFPRVFNQTPATVVKASTRLGPLQFQDGLTYGGTSGYRLQASPRDFARIGWWWRNKGLWKTTQLLAKSYFDSFMKTQVSSSVPRTAGGAVDDYLNVGTGGGGTNQDFPGQGRYGFNWWFNPNKITWPDAPADTIQAIGHFNQESMVIIPSLSMVVAWKGRNSTAGTLFTDANRYFKLLVEAQV
jgi:CubicO group peptidase (beta-lactamase class C family)